MTSQPSSVVKKTTVVKIGRIIFEILLVRLYTWQYLWVLTNVGLDLVMSQVFLHVCAEYMYSMCIFCLSDVVKLRSGHG